MTMLSMSLLYLQKNSEFFKAYQNGVHKSKYWELYYDDAMNLLAKLPRIAAVIYRHKYKNSQLIEADNSLDWAANFAHMLGYNDFNMRECMRGYLSIHSDHEGGNVSAHTAHLVGSALADPYLSYSAALNGLAGPLHGLANQECLKWLMELKEFHKGERPNKAIIEQFVNKTLGEGRVIPGYGHAVLRNTDPRFMHLKEFADRNIQNDYICDLARVCFETVPGILGKVGKIKNPYPNVDAYSGCLLQHYGNFMCNFKVWSRTIFTLVFSLFQELWDAFLTVSGQELSVSQSKDQIVSTFLSWKDSVENNDLYLSFYLTDSFSFSSKK